MAIAIADAGPLIALTKINPLYLLPALFTEYGILNQATYIKSDHAARFLAKFHAD